jgi:tRNA-splicing ligase RtcB
LPSELATLAWFDIKSSEGQEYWKAMELMGLYAAANHEIIHNKIAAHLGCEVIHDIENHHNFAWKEKHFGRDVIVHRKGATPAGKDNVGIIPGSMTAPGFIVRGKGNPDSLNSASHGAGRKMSRKAASKRFKWNDIKHELEKHGVELISAGIDEAPMAYKDIEEVMSQQRDLVSIVARFQPRLVKMAR